MKPRPVFYLICKDCSHRKEANARFLREINISSIEVLKPLVLENKFTCSECRSKNIELKQKPTAKPIVQYVGTINSVGRVFHKSACGWMNNVSIGSEIRFSSRDDAVKQKFRPCGSCKP